jgi:hypothetical protein
MDTSRLQIPGIGLPIVSEQAIYGLPIGIKLIKIAVFS